MLISTNEYFTDGEFMHSQFTHGDGFDSWRVDPCIMIQPHGRFWIPPLLDTEKAL
jgi:hypothetical protein